MRKKLGCEKARARMHYYHAFFPGLDGKFALFLFIVCACCALQLSLQLESMYILVSLQCIDYPDFKIPAYRISIFMN